MIALRPEERCPSCGSQEASDLLIPDDNRETDTFPERFGLRCAKCDNCYGVSSIDESRYQEIAAYLLDEMARDEVLLKYGEGKGRYTVHPSRLEDA